MCMSGSYGSRGRMIGFGSLLFSPPLARWIADSQLASAVIEVATSFLRGTQRIGSVKFYFADSIFRAMS